MANYKIIRLATAADIPALLAIYAPYVRETVISFEYDVPSLTEFGGRLRDISTRYPWLVCELDGVVAGYAYASRYSARAAYEWSVDASVYIGPEFQRRKVATALYTCLFELLALQGFCNVFACITSSNTVSERFHQAFGFKPAGIFHRVGYKFQQWHDVLWMERTLAEHPQAPQKPKGVVEIAGAPEYGTIVAKALRIIE